MGNYPNIAVSVPLLNMGQALEVFHNLPVVANFVELRLDYYQSHPISSKDLATLIKGCPLPTIITNRPIERGCGGCFYGSQAQRVAILEEAVNLGADYVDIECNEGLYHELRRGEGSHTREPTKIIVSYHNFEQTPFDLESFYHELLTKSHDIVKMATMATDISDNLRMLELVTKARRNGNNIIGICMGEFGRISRLIGPFVGSYFAYAALNEKEATAPGQYSADDLYQAWKASKLKETFDLFISSLEGQK